MSYRNETKILKDLYNKSRMMGDYHVRFCERFRGEIPLYLLDTEQLLKNTRSEGKVFLCYDTIVNELDYISSNLKWISRQVTVGDPRMVNDHKLVKNNP